MRRIDRLPLKPWGDPGTLVAMSLFVALWRSNALLSIFTGTALYVLVTNLLDA